MGAKQKKTLQLALRSSRRAGLVFLLFGLWSNDVSAQSAARSDEAGVTYRRGLAAHERGEYAEAAKLFAEADSIAPNDTALGAAIDEAILAEDPVLAMSLTDRALERPPNEGVQLSVAQAKAKFGDKTGRMVVRCAGSIRCEVKVDGKPIKSEQSVWVLAGPRSVVVRFGEKQIQQTVEVEARAKQIVNVAPPADEPLPPPRPTIEREPTAPPPTHPPESASAFSSPWFWLGAGLTTGFAVASVWSANDLAGKHETFSDTGCDRVGTAGCDSMASDGESAQLRTNLLLGATALFGAATVVVTLVPIGSAQPNASTGGLTPVLTARGTF